MFPRQNYVPHMLQGSHMENSMLRPPGNLNSELFDESSKKRKFMDQLGSKSGLTNEYGSPFGSNMPMGTVWGAQAENQAYESQQTKVTGPNNFMHQYANNQFQYQNSYPGPLAASNMNFLPNGTQTFGNVPSPSLPPPPLPLPLPPPPPRSSVSGGSFGSVNLQAMEGVPRSLWQSHACSTVGSLQNNQSINGGIKDVGNHNYNFPQNGLLFGASRPFDVSCGDISESRGQENFDNSVRAIKKMEESELKNLNYSLPGVSPINCSTPKSVETSHQKDSVSLTSIEKDKVDDGKADSTAAEKLWEGSLQLSSTVTVPSVAFFKSGEKLLNINWYKSVEVKGKVRLDAFEKYIEDLPCSHNKGLMVISLCCKEGSSETGLKSMKEVARGYTKTNRVGFAHLSREIHLYICPRTDAIITILAKYGFFTGMAAIEDEQYSMIGCVIWRKVRTPSSNSGAKKPETKSKAISETSDEDSDLEDSPLLMQLVQEIVAPLSATFTAIVEGDGKNDSEGSKNPSKTQIESSHVLSVAQKPENSNLRSHEVAQGGSTWVNNQQINQLATEQPKESFSFQNHIIPSPKVTIEKISFDDVDDDDDLPEFDFMATCKPFLSNVSKPHVRETLESIEQANPLPIPAFTHLEKRDGEQNQKATSLISDPAITPKKNFFDNDDMPEWCPPEQQARSLEKTITPHNMPSTFPFPNVQNTPRGPPISPQGFPHVGYFHTPQPRPLQRGPGFESVSHSDPSTGTPPGFNNKLLVDRANQQGWWPR